jgi:hypothetical protein
MKKIMIKGWLTFILCCIFCISYAQPNITRVEYYIDADPGYGKATNINITPSTDINSISFNLDPSAVATGVHVLGIRAKDANGAWSHDNKWIFAKAYPPLPDSTSPPLLSQLEYYFDQDPGYGKGIPVAIPVSNNLSDIQISTNITGLSAGKHGLFIRAKDANGVWGHDNTDSFNIPSAISSPAINVNSIAAKTSNCARDSFDISYDATGTYSEGNKFNVELSDANGSFSSPINIGSYEGTNNSIIRVKLPSHLPDGSGYKMRINSTNPVISGISSTASINIHDRPNAPTITGPTDANATFSYPYSISTVTGSTWKWIAPSADITQTNSNANLKWNNAGLPDTIQAIETNQYGCVGDTGSLQINVYNLKIENVASSSLTPCPLGAVTVTGNATGVYDGTNKFIAQLSDAAGNFNFPVNIGSITANPVGVSKAVSINATLPFPLANGTGYRVRVVSSSPSVTASDNGQNIVINKPDLGIDQTIKKCLGFNTDISNAFNTTGLTKEWSISDPSSVDVGAYSLTVSNANGCKDTANVIVADFAKPNLGADKSTTISCANGTADLTTVYNTSGLTAVYTASVANAATVGNYSMIVTNTDGCKDTANINVLDASTATVPSSGANVKTASRECTDAEGWTHYYSDNGTPTDYSDDIRLLSIKKNGNNIGAIGDGTFEVKVAATAGAGTNHAVVVSSALINADSLFYSMNRYWNITATAQPTSSVGVRFYYNSQDLTDINGNVSGISPTQLLMYKLLGGNPDPTTGWVGATSDHFYINGTTPDINTWVYTSLGNDRHQAEFVVNNFSGGGAGAVQMRALPVDFTSFNASVTNSEVQLSWATATEINSKEFEIQRSFDATSFETIGKVKAAGNSNSLRNYLFMDAEAMSLEGRQLFYRIAERDLDGKQLFTNIKSVKIPEGKNKLTVVYNPVTNLALLRYQSVANAKIQIRVIDHLGRTFSVIEQTVQPGKNEIKLQTGNLAKGIYEVVLISNLDQEHVRMMKE